MDRQLTDPSNVPETAQPVALAQAEPAEPRAAAAAPAPPAAAPAKPRRLRRFLDWFWRGRALRSARSDLVQAPARLKQLHHRARTCFTAGEAALNPRGSGPWTYAPYVACDLLRQSCHWALAAITSSDDDVRPQAVWNRANRELLIQAAGSADDAERLRAHLVRESFVPYAELPLEEQKALAGELRTFALRLLDVLEAPQRTIDRFWRQRVVRVGLVLALLALLATSGVLYAQYQRDATDIARGKPWRASSEWAKCEPDKRRCGGTTNTGIFFHTQEEEGPWLEIDLGSRQRFSSFRIENRKDCCLDRAIPLIVEVSDDKQNWREIARRTKPFRSWAQDISAQTARYVRLRIPRRSALHLDRVALFP